MILLRLPISYQLVNVININVDINYQNRLLSISMRYQLSEHSLINFNININIAIFASQYFLINALSSSGVWHKCKVIAYFKIYLGTIHNIFSVLCRFERFPVAPGGSFDGQKWLRSQKVHGQ